MLKIEKSIEYINEELSDAKKYALCAAKAKSNGDSAVYQTAIKLADEELSHADMWHDVAMNQIKAARAEMQSKGVEVPEYMEYKWAQAHEEYVELYAEIRYMIEAAKK